MNSKRAFQTVAAAAAIATCFGASTASASITAYLFSIDQAASTMNTSASVSAPLAGTFKGNYDPDTNPEGTMTRPGLFGGSGNMPIPYTGTVSGGGPAQAQPFGVYRLDLNPGASSVNMSNLAIDALGGAQPVFPATFSILYQTFRTFQPNSTFPGGVPLPIPLGDFTLTSFIITQTSASMPGPLTPTGKNTFDFSVIAEANVAFAGDLNGSPVFGEVPALLNVNGSVTTAGNTASAVITIQWSTTHTDPDPFTPFVDVPLDVPTVLPSGYTAHLLMSGEIQSITTEAGVNGNAIATGALFRPADINGDGVVNVNDLLALINAWGACPAPPVGCPADIAPQPSGDGVVNVNDLLMVINSWG